MKYHQFQIHLQKKIISPISGLLKILDNLSQEENNLLLKMIKYETEFIINIF